VIPHKYWNKMAMTESRPLFIRLTLPDGLEEALEGLAREVLRHQPENILDFAANHFDQLLKKRGTTAKKNDNLDNGIDNDLQSIEDEDGLELENIEGNCSYVNIYNPTSLYFHLIFNLQRQNHRQEIQL